MKNNIDHFHVNLNRLSQVQKHIFQAKLKKRLKIKFSLSKFTDKPSLGNDPSVAHTYLVVDKIETLNVFNIAFCDYRIQKYLALDPMQNFTHDDNFEQEINGWFSLKKIMVISAANQL